MADNTDNTVKVTKVATGKHVKTFKNHASPAANLVPLNQRGTKKQPARQSIDNQIPQLKEAIRINLIRAGHLALNNRNDAAVQRMKYAMHQYNKLMALLDTYADNQLKPAAKQAQEQARPSPFKVQVKAKRYKMFSDK